MSASREKKARQEFNASGAVDPKAAREAQERAKQRRSNWLYGGIAIVFVLVAAALLVWNSNVIQRGSAAVTVEGRVNTDVPGDYTLTYQADFRGRSYTAKRLVHVEDREAPELALTGQAEVTVSRYDLFQDPGATARDRCDGDLTASIQVTDKASGDVHTLTYTVTDKAGNAATADKVLELTKKIVAENHITCLMITHNMHAALELGNRTLMMDSGHIVLDISGKERANTTVDGLLDQFAKNVGRRLDNDRILLSRQEETAQ